MIRHHAARLARGASRAASRAARTAAQRLGALWATHSRLLRETAAYAATVGAAAAAAATQHGWRDVLAVIISAAVAVWTAIRTGHRHYPEPRRGSPLDPLEDWQ